MKKLTEALGALCQEQTICGRCGATLAQYRAGKQCSADLADPCPGFMWVEESLARSALEDRDG